MFTTKINKNLLYTLWKHKTKHNKLILNRIKKREKMDEKETRKLLGENIRRIRWSRNMTQEAFSEKIGIEPSSLSNIENGKSLPSTQTILNIQKQFDVSPNDIFDFDIDYIRSGEYLEEEILNSVKTLDMEKKRVLYKIVKAIEVRV